MKNDPIITFHFTKNTLYSRIVSKIKEINQYITRQNLL